MRVTYWKRESITDGRLIALFKVVEDEDGIEGFIYKDGKWQPHETIAARAGYDDDYDYITEAEAKRLM